MAGPKKENRCCGTCIYYAGTGSQVSHCEAPFPAWMRKAFWYMEEKGLIHMINAFNSVSRGWEADCPLWSDEISDADMEKEICAASSDFINRRISELAGVSMLGSDSRVEFLTCDTVVRYRLGIDENASYVGCFAYFRGSDEELVGIERSLGLFFPGNLYVPADVSTEFTSNPASYNEDIDEHIVAIEAKCCYCESELEGDFDCCEICGKPCCCMDDNSFVCPYCEDEFDEDYEMEFRYE